MFTPGLEARIKELTDGRGADCVIEGVGLEAALKTAFDVLRPWGNISSFGVHSEGIPWSGSQAYGKNLNIQMGRCPVRSIFTEAMEVLRKNQHKLESVLPLSSIDSASLAFFFSESLPFSRLHKPKLQYFVKDGC